MCSTWPLIPSWLSRLLVLLRLPLLQHFPVNTKSRVKTWRDLLNDAYCCHIAASFFCEGGHGRVIVRSRNFLLASGTTHDHLLHDSCLRIDYFQRCRKQCLFPDSSLLDHRVSTLPNEVEEKIAHMIQVTVKNGPSYKKLEDLQDIFSDNSTSFETSLSSVSAVDIASLNIDSFPDAKPAKVCCCIFSQDQRESLSAFVEAWSLANYPVPIPCPRGPFILCLWPNLFFQSLMWKRNSAGVEDSRSDNDFRFATVHVCWPNRLSQSRWQL